jgi:hypothetical protein
MLKLWERPQFPVVFVVAKLVYYLNAVTFFILCNKMSTGAGDDKASFPVFFVTILHTDMAYISYSRFAWHTDFFGL